MSNLQNCQDETLEREISIRDMLDFFKDSWRTITIFAMLGLICGIFYIWITPNQYQATAQIQMAQFAGNSNSANNIMSPIGVNVEDPARLISRLQLPTTYSNEVVNACGLKESEKVREKLVKLIKASPSKGGISIVEVTINRESKKVALACMNALFDEISQTQAEMAEPFFQEIAKNLSDNLLKIERTKSTFKQAAGNSNLLVAPAYILARDEINRLADNNILLEYLLQFKNIRKTRLISPIYVSPDPVAPKKLIVILVGLMGGLLIGIFIPLLRRMLKP